MHIDTTDKQALFRRVRVDRHDERLFVVKLIVALSLTGIGVLLVLASGPPGVVAGVVVLALTYTHMVELQHQCLHHSAFRRSELHRPVGFLLGLPLLSAYSHYRTQHLQHHKFLGTAQDSEFFGFDTRAPVTWTSLLRGMFSPARLLRAGLDMLSSCRGNWQYTMGTVPDRVRRRVITEYRLFAAGVAAGVLLCVAGQGRAVLLLWVVPVLISVPVHFLLELPEHVLCDNDSSDVLLNTRTIGGSRFSRWFTNGNNFHVEHHAAMVVPINRLPGRHPVARRWAKHKEDSYPRFYLRILREASTRRGTLVRRADDA